MYGVFEDMDQQEIHVIECNDQGEVTSPHTVDSFCICEPVVDFCINGFIGIIHREGANG